MYDCNRRDAMGPIAGECCKAQEVQQAKISIHIFPCHQQQLSTLVAELPMVLITMVNQLDLKIKAERIIYRVIIIQFTSKFNSPSFPLNCGANLVTLFIVVWNKLKLYICSSVVSRAIVSVTARTATCLFYCRQMSRLHRYSRYNRRPWLAVAQWSCGVLTLNMH